MTRTVNDKATKVSKKKEGKKGKPPRPLSACKLMLRYLICDFVYSIRLFVKPLPTCYHHFHTFDSDNIFFAIERKKILEERERKAQEDNTQMAKVGFAGLANIVATRWRDVDAEYKKELEEMAGLERKQYEKKVLEWKLKLKEEAESAESLESSPANANEASESEERTAFDRNMASWTESLFYNESTTQSPSGVAASSSSAFHTVQGFSVPAFEQIHLPFQVQKAAGFPSSLGCAESQPAQFMRNPLYFNQSLLANKVSYAASMPNNLTFHGDWRPSSMISNQEHYFCQSLFSSTQEMGQDSSNNLTFHGDWMPSSMISNQEHYSGQSLFSSTREMEQDSSTDLAHTLPIEEIQRYFGIDPEKYKIVSNHQGQE
jgi:hypothetical protein